MMETTTIDLIPFFYAQFWRIAGEEKVLSMSAVIFKFVGGKTSQQVLLGAKEF